MNTSLIDYIDNSADTFNSSFDMQREASVLIAVVNATIYANDSAIVAQILNMNTSNRAYDLATYLGITNANTLLGAINTTMYANDSAIMSIIINQNTTNYALFDDTNCTLDGSCPLITYDTELQNGSIISA